MGISGPASVHHRGGLVALCVITAVTALGVTLLALWGPSGSRRPSPVGDGEEAILAWADEATRAWQEGMCRDPERAMAQWLHPTTVEAVSEAWLDGSSPRDCGSDDVEIHAVSATRLSDDALDEFGAGGMPALTDADAVWALRFAGSSAEATIGTWWVVVEGGRKYLFSPYLHIHAECALDEQEC